MKEISIPKFLHDIHGEKTTFAELLLTYSGGLFSIVAIGTLYSQSVTEISWWRFALLLLISADIGAGVVANFTKGTNQYYSGKKKSKTRIGFILAHLIHPGLFLFALHSFSFPAIVLVLYTIMASFLINAIREVEKQSYVAGFFLVSGMSLLFLFQFSNPFLLWFFPVFMVKLFLAFGIRRYT